MKKQIPIKQDVLKKEIHAYIDLDYCSIQSVKESCDDYIRLLSKEIPEGEDKSKYSMRFIIKDGYYDSKDTYAQLYGPETDKEFEKRIKIEENNAKMRKENQLKNLKSDIKKLPKKERDLLLQDLENLFLLKVFLKMMRIL